MNTTATAAKATAGMRSPQLRKYPIIVQESTSLAALLSAPPEDCDTHFCDVPCGLQDLPASELILEDRDRFLQASRRVDKLVDQSQPRESAAAEAWTKGPEGKTKEYSVREFIRMLDYIKEYHTHKSKEQKKHTSVGRASQKRRKKTQKEVGVLHELIGWTVGSAGWELKRDDVIRRTGLTVQQINKWRWDQLNRKKSVGGRMKEKTGADTLL